MVAFFRAFLLLILFACPLLAKEYPFVLSRGFLHPDAFDIGGQGNEVGFVFQNPARILPHTKELQLSGAVSSSPDFFGYDQVSLASQLSIDDIAFGFGMVSFSAGGLNEATLDLNDRPRATGKEFKDDMARYVASFAVRYNEALRIGAQLTYFSRELFDNSVSYYGVDAGVYYETKFGLGLGAYTRGAYHSDYQWEDSKLPEDLQRTLIIEGDYRYKNMLGRLSTDFDMYRGMVQYQYGQLFGLHGDAVVDEDFSLKRYGAGTSVGLGRLQFIYWYYMNKAGDRDLQQHSLGLRFAI
jgi:hypothetical protein